MAGFSEGRCRRRHVINSGDDVQQLIEVGASAGPVQREDGRRSLAAALAKRLLGRGEDLGDGSPARREAAGEHQQ